MEGMKLFKRSGSSNWYVRIGGRRVSTGTPIKRLARVRAAALEKEYFEKRVLGLDPGKRLTLESFIALYLKAAEATKATETFKKDRLALRNLSDFLGPSTLLSRIRVKHVENFQRHLLALGLAPSSVNQRFRHCKAAFSWAVREEILRENPWKKVKQLRVERKVRRYLQPEEIRAILDVAEPELLRALIIFYLYTGARCAEALAVEWKDIELEGDNPRVVLHQTKGKKDVVVPLLEPVLEALRPFKVDIGRVFPWKRDWVIRKISQLWKECGIEIERPVHVFRYTFGTYMAMGGAPLQATRDLLGHTSSSTTDIYTQTIRSRLRGIMEDCLRYGFVPKSSQR